VEGSSGWFEIISRSEIPRLMTEGEPSAWMARRLLERAWPFAPAEVLRLLQRHWAETPAYDNHLWTVLDEAPFWGDEHTKLGVSILGRTDINQWRIEQTVSKLGVEQPSRALRLVRAHLDRVLAKALAIASERLANTPPAPTDPTEHLGWLMQHSPNEPLKNLLEGNRGWDVLASLADTAPRDFLEALWPWFLAALKGLAALEERSDNRPDYPLCWSLDFRLDDEDDGLSLIEKNMLTGFRLAADGLAKDPIAFREWVRENARVEFHPVQRLIAHAMATDGETYAADAFQFLAEDTRRFYLGGYADQSSTTKDLIRAASAQWDQATIEAFVRKVRAYRFPGLPPEDADSRRSRASGLRRLKLELLKALPTEKTDDELKSFLRQETRVFPDDVIGLRAGEDGFIGSPMSTEAMTKASNAAIVNAFREIPDSTGWHHPRHWIQGGSIQLSRAFAEFSKLYPGRAAEIIKSFEPGIGERAAGYALDAMAESADPELVLLVFHDVVDRGFREVDEFRDTAARAVQRLSERKIEIGEDVIAVLVSWLEPFVEPATREAVDRDEDRPSPKSGKDETNNGFRSVLWDSLHFTTLPHGNYPILEALTVALLRRGEHDRIVQTWEDHLAHAEDPKVWQALLRLMRYLNPTDPSARARLMSTIFERYPTVAQSREAAHLLAYAHWWAQEEVRQVLEPWPASEDAWRRQAYGELTGLIALVRPELQWAQDMLTGSLHPTAAIEAKAGAAFAAINLWKELKFRPAANRILLALIPQADPKLWTVILDLFRHLDELRPEPETVALLRAIADHAASAGRQSMTYLFERLQTLLPHEALTVGRIALVMVANLGEELADLRTSSALDAPGLIDLAITLHRLGGETRELGTRLFEDLLRIDAYTAHSTLDEIDNRLRNRAAGPRRPQLPRRQKNRRAPRRTMQTA
jgi:hypothetical protein